MPPDFPAADGLDRLRAKLAALGPERVWRPVPGPAGDLLAAGDGSAPAVLDGYLAGLDVAGKTVADLGCNLGYYSFLVRRMGARAVLGCDIDPEIIRLAEALAAIHGLTEVRFATMDFLRRRPETPCDMALLIDFIGRQTVAKGRLSAVAAAASAFGSREIFCVLRPVYAVADLPLPAQDLARLHPGFVRQDRFFLAECLAALLGPDWTMRIPEWSGRSRLGQKTPVLYVKTGV
jgi:ribosomal protein L11 methyltransferase